MHPDVCQFISDAVYEDRLAAHPNTDGRALDRFRAPGTDASIIDNYMFQ
jgi:hypothetical protein